ncbi:AraC family transcriptional regulator [Mariniflexile litorale]|uniref:AraC family transcriptional regulator n=1 Tax=Mariniflexile litorale TaxID=3045158 RepID=A0AAU7EDN2_9FLAO|nr:AraC family transcriptional regulator [Mariniflexile sp. KMM 9835]MDQ8210420.1 AraC family transcriptional regulator [Mariniflexile sp. KMM 9835]
MKKKRREKENFKKVYLTDKKISLKSYLSEEVKRKEHCGLLKIEYLVRPEYGKGHITEFHFDGVVISISNFIFHQNFIFYKTLDVNALSLSFLVRGEMLLQVDETFKERSYEENESFMAYIERFKGALKVYAKKHFKEIKITVFNTFLKKHGFIEGVKFKKVTDQDLILPITNTMFVALEALEIDYGAGLLQRLFLEAKVLEIIALQLASYETMNLDRAGFTNQKPIKKLFLLKQLLKENLDKNYSIKELAEETGLSENILKSEFKRIFNCTINQYFLNQKMKKATHLLQNTDSPIYEIAESVGYKNATHFSAAFKRFYNETPKVCRGKL